MNTLMRLSLFLPVFLLIVVIFTTLIGMSLYRVLANHKAKLLRTDFNYSLKDIQLISRRQYINAFQYLNSINRNQKNEANDFLLSLMLPESFLQPGTGLRTLSLALKEINSAKTCNKLLSLRDEIKYSYSNLQEYIRYYTKNVNNTEADYYRSILELSKMRDNLESYVYARNANKTNDSSWFESYLSVFDTWFRDGGNRDVETSYKQIVVKIIDLNRLYANTPFALQSNLYAMNCDAKYSDILSLNDELASRILKYGYYQKLCYKIVRLISQTPKGNLITEPLLISVIANKQSIAPITNIALSNKIETTTERVPATKKEKAASIYYLSAAALFICLATIYFTLPVNIHSKERIAVAPPGIKILPALNFAKMKIPVQNDFTGADTLYNKDDFKVLFDSSSRAASNVYGIDISKYQGNMIEELKSLDTLHFLICKATEGAAEVDVDFENNWKFIKQREYIRGAYHFFHSDDSPIRQAAFFLQTVNGLRDTDMPPIVDVEGGSLKGTVSASRLDSSLNIFLKYVRSKTHRTPIIYSNLSFANQYLIDSSFADYPLWLGEYSTKQTPLVPKVWKNKGYVIWQRSDSYSIGSKKTDFDVFHGDGKAMAKFIISN